MRNRIADLDECVRRSLQAMGDTQDVDVRASLWRNAVKWSNERNELRATTHSRQAGLVVAPAQGRLGGLALDPRGLV